jgi:MATE family multidrug resistance protein
MSASSSDTLPWLDRPLAELLRLSWPVTVSMLSYSVMTLVDTMFVARLGSAQLAGVGLAGTVSFTLISFGYGLVRGGKTLVSQAVGAGRRDEAGGYLGAALLAGLLFGILAIGLQWPVSVLLSHFASSPAQAHHFAVYLLIRSFGSPSSMIFNALREVRYGEGDARSPMVATLIANVVNIVLGYLFIFPLHGGVAGAAWATVAAQTVEAGVLAVYQHRDGWGVSTMTRAHLTALVRIGIPTGLQMLLEVGAFALLAAMIASLSEAQMAAHQIALQVISFSFLPAFAIGESAAVLTGQVVGASRDDLVMPVTTLALRVVTAYTTLCTIAFALLAANIVDAFAADDNTRGVAIRLVRAATLFLIADGANIVSRSSLRGTGDVRFPAAVGVVCSWMLTPPLAWLLGFHLHMGALGGWLGLSGEVFFGATIQWWRLIRGGWRPHAARTRAEVMSAAQG